MQTLHLRFRALRAISLGQSPDRWSSPSLRAASTWKGASPLPNHPRPTSAVGSRPKTSRQQFARCPSTGAGLPLASPFAGRKPQRTIHALPPTVRLGRGWGVLCKLHSQRCFAPLQTGCLFPSGPSVLERGPTG